MTNEEKAQEIYNITYKQCIKDDYPEIVSKTCAIMSKTGAEIMAEWKEQQMIDKACEWLKKNMSVVNANAVNYGDISFAASKIIGGKENFLEQFKKAMEEQQ